MEEGLKLNQVEIDQIKMVNESASKAAAKALTKMINKETKVDYPSLSLKPIEEIKKIKESDLLAISEVSGDLEGNLLVFHSIESGLKLVEFMTSQPLGSLKEIDEKVISAYKEFVNIIGGAYLSNLANFLGFKVLPEVPKFIGKLDKVKKELDKEMNKEVGKLLMIKTELEIESEKVVGDFFIIFNETSLKKIIKTIRD